MPAAAADWSGGVDPGDIDNALDQPQAKASSKVTINAASDADITLISDWIAAGARDDGLGGLRRADAVGLGCGGSARGARRSCGAGLPGDLRGG